MSLTEKDLLPPLLHCAMVAGGIPCGKPLNKRAGNLLDVVFRTFRIEDVSPMKLRLVIPSLKQDLWECYSNLKPIF